MLLVWGYRTWVRSLSSHIENMKWVHCSHCRDFVHHVLQYLILRNNVYICVQYPNPSMGIMFLICQIQNTQTYLHILVVNHVVECKNSKLLNCYQCFANSPISVIQIEVCIFSLRFNCFSGSVGSFVPTGRKRIGWSFPCSASRLFQPSHCLIWSNIIGHLKSIFLVESDRNILSLSIVSSSDFLSSHFRWLWLVLSTCHGSTNGWWNRVGTRLNVRKPNPSTDLRTGQ